MFTVDRREQVRTLLLAKASDDERVTGAAVTGSRARGAEDRWSDVDLFFGVTADVEVDRVLADWSAFLYGELGAVHHFDLHAGPAVYRAFLLDDLLEVDLGFTPDDSFGPRGHGVFQPVFGDPVQRRAGGTDPAHLIGLCWHHVLHARAAVERGRCWQAEHWIARLRDTTIALACLRLGHPADHAKGAHLLPAQLTALVADALVHSLDAAELRRALGSATRAFLAELGETNAELSRRLGGLLRQLG